jgi:hypothetical protein
MASLYQPPANIDDYSRRPALAAQLRQNWHDYIFTAIAKRDRNLFYNGLQDPLPTVAAKKVQVPWNAFPRSIWQWFNADSVPAGADRAFAAAEVLRPLGTLSHAAGKIVIAERQQDEYCEWHTRRNAAGGITAIDFTCEGPEYFERMWSIDPTLVLELYQAYVDPTVKMSDLAWPANMANSADFPAGGYNPWNRWNTLRGAMHLTHSANTLGAEINLAADATVLVPISPNPASSLAQRLMCCAGYGGVNRSSDPTIGAGVNGLARAGSSVTLRNPVGLYISEIALDGLRDPNGAPIGPAALTVLRASADKSLKLRIRVAPPAGAAYTLDQCSFEGRKVSGGGVFARRITMVLFAEHKIIPARQADNAGCRTRCCRHPDARPFFQLIGATQNCTALTAQNWASLGPVEPAGIALADEAVIAPPEFVPATYSRRAASLL